MASSLAFDPLIGDEITRYARFCVSRNYVSNQLGNIAVRTAHDFDRKFGVVYTKRRGISLEEMTAADVVITDVQDGALLHGDIGPSIGHILNRTVFQERPDINAVIHLHVDIVIAYFVTRSCKKEFGYLGIDSPLVLKKSPYVLDNHINVEADVAYLRDFILETNCFIMPNHGVTTLGRTLSEAYHRLNTLVAEVRRIYYALAFSQGHSVALPFLENSEVQQLYDIAENIV